MCSSDLDTDEEAKRRAWEILGYVRTSPIVAPQFVNPPGYVSVENNAKAMRAAAQPGYVPIYAQVLKRDGSRVPWKTATVDELIDSYCIFVGTPDKVHAQIKEFYEYVGGCDNILMMGQGGNLDHAATMDNYRMFSREVLPRLRELTPPDEEKYAAMNQAAE